MQTEPQIAFVCRKRLRVKQEKPALHVQAFQIEIRVIINLNAKKCYDKI